MTVPKPLKPGACVGLIAPSSPVTPRERRCCVAGLQNMGFSVVTGEALRQDKNMHGYLAGTPRERAEDVNRMFADRRVDAIFCVRGGYGSSQLLPYLDYAAIRQTPKVFVGFSDVTSLHTALQRYCHFVTFHGPMGKPNLMSEPNLLAYPHSYTMSSLFAACSQRQPVMFENPAGQQLRIIREGHGEGRLIGGNLSVLVRSLGTPYAPELSTASEKIPLILFLEEVGEPIPKIHMYLTQLFQSGMFDGVQGVLLGSFTGSEAQDKGWGVEELLKDWFGALGVPVIGNVCSDHRTPMGTLPLGACCRMEAECLPAPKIQICFFGKP